MSAYNSEEFDIREPGPYPEYEDAELAEFLEYPMEFELAEIDFNGPLSLKDRLESLGYEIPVLKVEREVTRLDWSSDDFRLPRSTHDIYEDVSYEEFQEILGRLSPSHDNSDVIRFKIDYESIWRGLTGKPM
jgi:hypothetical protein